MRQGRDPRRAAELASHHDQRRVEQAALVQVVEQGRDGPVGRREQLVFQMREGVAVRVPGLVVPEIHLNQIDPRLDQAAGHQERPAERVPAVAIQDLRLGINDVEGLPDSRVGQERDCRLAVLIERGGLGDALERAPAAIERLQQFQAMPKRAVNPSGSDRLGTSKSCLARGVRRSWWSNSYPG